MTPNDIEVLIHCYVSPTPHPRADAPAVREAIRQFLKNGLIAKSPDGDYYSTTERGALHIEQLCNTPWPRQAWIDASGRVIPSTTHSED